MMWGHMVNWDQTTPSVAWIMNPAVGPYSILNNKFLVFAFLRNPHQVVYIGVMNVNYKNNVSLKYSGSAMVGIWSSIIGSVAWGECTSFADQIGSRFGA